MKLYGNGTGSDCGFIRSPLHPWPGAELRVLYPQYLLVTNAAVIQILPGPLCMETTVSIKVIVFCSRFKV